MIADSVCMLIIGKITGENRMFIIMNRCPANFGSQMILLLNMKMGA